MQAGASDEAIRVAAFAFLAKQSAIYGEVLPRSVLAAGFVYEGRRVPLLGPQGIFKPALAELPLSITTAPAVEGKTRPYDDDFTHEGLLRYRYRGHDPRHHENQGLRRAMASQRPLIYFHGIVPSQYLAAWPVYVVADDPSALTFTVAVDDRQALAVGGVDASTEDVRRRYVTRLVRQRLHQNAFRIRVLRAYRDTCSICRLHHPVLLDAAHILGDTHALGEPVVSNGLALCKLHHAAFDSNILGIRPDLVVELRSDVLREIDGPMLLHGLQGFEGRTLTVPRSELLRPNREFLAERYEAFREAG